MHSNGCLLPSLQLLEFDQSEFFTVSDEWISMDKTGYLYVPSACRNKSNGIIDCMVRARTEYMVSVASSLSVAHRATWQWHVKVVPNHILLTVQYCSNSAAIAGRSSVQCLLYTLATVKLLRSTI